MKRIRIAFAILMATFYHGHILGQQKNKSRLSPPWPPTEQHIAADSFPSKNMINYLDNWGGMAVGVNAMPAGTDLAPLLKGLKNNSCQVPHWGYIVKGSLRLTYDSGKEVVLKEGDLFYMPPGHKGKVDEDLKLFDFSPQEEFKILVSHVGKRAAEMQNKK